eukprot:jgi/Chlat1/4861/Chrsp31S04887
MAYQAQDVRQLASGMEYSVHRCPKSYAAEMRALLPAADTQRLLIVPTCQKSTVDLVQVGPHVSEEKDRCLEVFMEWAQRVCDTLIRDGHYADFIDPCSGLPMVHRDGANYTYGEVDALQTLLGYKTANAGCCKVVLHPTWGSSVYPATMFTTAPLQTLVHAIESNEEHNFQPQPQEQQQRTDRT